MAKTNQGIYQTQVIHQGQPVLCHFKLLGYANHGDEQVAQEAAAAVALAQCCEHFSWLYSPNYPRDTVPEGRRHAHTWAEANLQPVPGATDTKLHHDHGHCHQTQSCGLAAPEELTREVYQVVSELGFVPIESNFFLLHVTIVVARQPGPLLPTRHFASMLQLRLYPIGRVILWFDSNSSTASGGIHSAVDECNRAAVVIRCLMADSGKAASGRFGQQMSRFAMDMNDSQCLGAGSVKFKPTPDEHVRQFDGWGSREFLATARDEFVIGQWFLATEPDSHSIHLLRVKWLQHQWLKLMKGQAYPMLCVTNCLLQKNVSMIRKRWLSLKILLMVVLLACLSRLETTLIWGRNRIACLMNKRACRLPGRRILRKLCDRWRRTALLKTFRMNSIWIIH